MSYLHPGFVAVSEFARQVALGSVVLPGVPRPTNVQPGSYLHGTCVEASAYMLALASGAVPRLAPALVGDELQGMVNQWRAHNPGVSPNGASWYSDAVHWLQDLGLTVDGDLLQDPTAGYLEMRANLPHGYLYLVMFDNAQALPGDEPGVHGHAIAVGGVDDAGNLLCGDPDNARAQVAMPASPYGGLVSYSEANLRAGGVTSISRVHPRASGGPPMIVIDAAGNGVDAATQQTVGSGVAKFIEQHGWLDATLAVGETYALDASGTRVGSLCVLSGATDAVVTWTTAHAATAYSGDIVAIAAALVGQRDAAQTSAGMSSQEAAAEAATPPAAAATPPASKSPIAANASALVSAIDGAVSALDHLASAITAAS